MSIFLWILISTIVVSLISLIGILTLFFNKRIFKNIIPPLVALSAGALIGGAFLHLIPEAVKESSGNGVFFNVLLGFVLFFLIEKFLHWRHCHKEQCSIHSFAYMNLGGELVHNFVDGLIIAAGFLANIQLGFITVLAVILHEIPQEIGDFGVLVFGGFKKTEALFFNFIVALSAVLGGIIGYFFASLAGSFVFFLIPFAAGGFIYIGASDLIPELRKETKLKNLLINFIIFLLGILIMYFLGRVMH